MSATTQDYMNQLLGMLPWIVVIYMIPSIIKAVTEAVKEFKK